jgi:hypothetical protein
MSRNDASPSGDALVLIRPRVVHVHEVVRRVIDHYRNYTIDYKKSALGASTFKDLWPSPSSH